MHRAQSKPRAAITATRRGGRKTPMRRADRNPVAFLLAQGLTQMISLTTLLVAALVLAVVSTKEHRAIY